LSQISFPLHCYIGCFIAMYKQRHL